MNSVEQNQTWRQLDRIEEKNCEVDNTQLVNHGNSTFRHTVPYTEVMC
jgi:hypothetical protein